MLLHASAEGTQYPARSLLRTPHHLLPLIEACKTLRGLKSLDLSLNALSDAQLPQLQHLMEAGVQLTCLDLSQNQFSSRAAAPLCSIISHVSHAVLSLGPGQAAAQTLSVQAAYSSDSAAEASAFLEHASASQNLGSAAQDSISQDISSAASTASGGLQSDSAAATSAAKEPAGEGGSSSRSAGEASTSESGTPSGVSHNYSCVQRPFQVNFLAPVHDDLKQLLMCGCSLQPLSGYHMAQDDSGCVLTQRSIAHHSENCILYMTCPLWDHKYRVTEPQQLRHRSIPQAATAKSQSPRRQGPTGAGCRMPQGSGCSPD